VRRLDQRLNSAMPFLEKLARLNRTAVFIGVLAVLLGALLLGAWGGLVLLALALALGALLYTTWPVQAPSTRALRLTVLVLLAATGLARIFFAA
jgi:asparagine N-glycosylation enzyme membrane subunit Stt3